MKKAIYVLALLLILAAPALADVPQSALQYTFNSTKTSTGSISLSLSDVGTAGTFNTSTFKLGNASYTVVPGGHIINATAAGTGLATGNVNFTISLWVYPNSQPTSGQYPYLFALGNNGVADGIASIRYQNASGTTTAISSGLTGSLTYTASLPTRQWTHLTWVNYVNKSEQLYLNGALVASGTHTNNLNLGFGVSTQSGLGIGGLYGVTTPVIPGVYDDVRYYEASLSAAQIAEIYASANGTECNPITSGVCPYTPPVITYMSITANNSVTSNPLTAFSANATGLTTHTQVIPTSSYTGASIIQDITKAYDGNYSSFAYATSFPGDYLYHNYSLPNNSVFINGTWTFQTEAACASSCGLSVEVYNYTSNSYVLMYSVNGGIYATRNNTVNLSDSLEINTSNPLQIRTYIHGQSGIADQRFYDGNFTAYLTQTNTYSTTNGTINTNISGGNIYNLTVYSANYFFNTTLNYNTSNNLAVNLNPYTLVHVTDEYSGSNIAAANVTLSGTTYITNSTGYAHIPVSSSTYSTNISASGYFIKEYTNQPQFTQLEAAIYQAQMNFAATDILGNSVTGFTVTAPNGKNTNNTILYAQSGSQSFTFNKTGYNNKAQTFAPTALSNSTYTFTGVGGSTINLTVYNAQSASYETTFNATVVSSTGYSATGSTTNGSIFVPWAIDTVNVTVQGAFATTTESFSVAASGLNNLTVTVYANNSIRINIYDESTGALISGTNITITLSGDTYNNQTTISTGQYNYTNLPSGTYSISFNGTTYVLRTYTVTVGEATSQALNAYLTTSTNTVQFTAIDANTGLAIPGDIISMARVINGSWTTVQTGLTDITGLAQFNYVPLVRYRFTSAATNYTTQLFYLDPILLTSYTIRMQPDADTANAQDYSEITFLFAPTKFYDGEQNNLTFTIGSPNGVLINYTATVRYPSGSGAYSTFTVSGSNANGDVLEMPFNISDAELNDRVNITWQYTSTIGGTKSYSYAYTITGASSTGLFTNNAREFYGMGAFERIFIVTFVVLLVVGATAPFIGGVPSGLLGLFALGYFTAIGFMPWVAAALSFLLGFALITWSGGKS
jgi:hypothetical protein